MKRFCILLLVVCLVLPFAPLSAFAADEQSATEFAQKKTELEKKYGIGITYPTDREGSPIIKLNSLLTLDMALENVTPNLVKQVSSYYKEKNGSKLTFSYVRSTSNLSGSSEAVLAGFDDKTSLIELYIPTGSGTVIATGETPISIVHEFGHAVHLMYCAKYGYSKMEKEWKAFNNGESYDPNTITNNPNTKVFVTGYAATSLPEDVAETFAHAFIRNQAGQGFAARLKSDGNQTGLGKKVAYVEKILSAYLTGTDTAVTNYRKMLSAATSVKYQGMKFSGDYMQYAGYPQPKYVLNGTLNSLDKTMDSAIWIRSIGAWYVKEENGSEIIVFPGGVWCEVNSSFVAPKAAA